MVNVPIRICKYGGDKRQVTFNPYEHMEINSRRKVSGVLVSTYIPASII
jgi:hypothetical protein